MNCPARKAAIVSSTLSKREGFVGYVPFGRAPLVFEESVMKSAMGGMVGRSEKVNDKGRRVELDRCMLLICGRSYVVANGAIQRAVKAPWYITQRYETST